jgi:cell shape-determining protein MreD
MSSRTGFTLALWLAAAYTAAVVQIRWPTGPNFVLALAAVWWCRHPGSRGVFGVAVAGLLLDALGNGRLGLHLGLCGLLAALSTTAFSPGIIVRWWMPPLMAAWLTFSDAALEAGLLSAITSAPFDLSATLQAAGTSAGITGGLVAGLMLFGFLARRCLSWSAESSADRLHNQWHRLTET